MVARIRIVETNTYEYIPDFSGDYCVNHDIKTIHDAIQQDREDLAEEKVTASDIAGTPITTTYQLDIIR